VGADGHKISFSGGLVALIWDVLNERVAVVGGNCLQGGGAFIEGECLVVLRDFQRGRGVSDSRSNSGTGVEARQPEITL